MKVLDDNDQLSTKILVELEPNFNVQSLYPFTKVHVEGLSRHILRKRMQGTFRCRKRGKSKQHHDGDSSYSLLELVKGSERHIKVLQKTTWLIVAALQRTKNLPTLATIHLITVL